MDEYRCTADPGTLDVGRTALFIAMLTESPIIRCVGVDERTGPMGIAKQQQLAAAGLAPSELDLTKQCFETEDLGRGWFVDHYNHMHVAAWP